MFKRLTLFLIPALLLTFFSPVSPAQAGSTLTLIASDSFEYSGNIVGKNGGYGFTGPWATHYGTSDFTVEATGFTYPNITTAGGLISSCAVLQGQLCGVSRDFAPQESGVFYVQMIANFGTQTGGGTPMLRFFDSSTAVSGGLGGNGGTAISILDNTLSVKGDGTASYGTLNATSFVVLQIDYVSNTTQMWVNPNMATFDYLNPPAPNASWPGLAPKMARIAFYARPTAKFDEYKLYRVDRPAIPEITSATVPVFKKGVQSTLTSTLDRSGKVTFLARGKRIPGCVSLTTPTTTPYTISCAWKPTVTGAFPITLKITPTTGTPAEIALTTAGVANRTTKR
ncbi:MAG: hypothetical protein ACKOXI_01645 [Candidatus Planktophila sp.]